MSISQRMGLADPVFQLRPIAVASLRQRQTHARRDRNPLEPQECLEGGEE